MQFRAAAVRAAEMNHEIKDFLLIAALALAVGVALALLGLWCHFEFHCQHMNCR